MADLTDILTTLKNGVVGLNNLQQTLSRLDQRYNGVTATAVLTGQTLVFAGSGYLSSISVTVAGSGAGTINDSATTGGAGAGNALCVVPMTAGVLHIGLPFKNGLVVTPGTGQSVLVCYTTS